MGCISKISTNFLTFSLDWLETQPQECTLHFLVFSTSRIVTNFCEIVFDQSHGAERTSKGVVKISMDIILLLQTALSNFSFTASNQPVEPRQAEWLKVLEHNGFITKQMGIKIMYLSLNRCTTKGQIISKYLFGGFNFFQKTN